MSKYVDIDEMKKRIHCDNPEMHDYKILMKFIDHLPEADVKPVVHAKWKVCGTFDDFLKCSECEWDAPMSTVYDLKINYCPNCGAKIDEEKYNG